MIDLFTWGNPVEIERKRRIRLTLWAYAYEVAGSSIVSDSQFDAEALLSDTSIDTGHIDDWWRSCFSPHTGMWIHIHPELDKVGKLYDRYTASAQLHLTKVFDSLSHC